MTRVGSLRARAVCAALLALTARADASERARTRVLLLCHDDRPCGALVARVRGQTSDLPVVIEERRERRLAGQTDDLDGMLRMADAEGTRTGSAVVLWWGADNQLIALLRSPPPARVLVRPVEGATPTRSGRADSATLEAAALIARTAIRASIEGRVIGVPRTELAKPADPRPAPSPPPAPVRPWRLLLGLGWEVVHDGVPSDPGHAWHGRFGVARWRARAGLWWSKALTSELGTDGARGTFDRSHLGGFVEATPWRRGRIDLALELRASAYRSEVTASNGPLRGTKTVFVRPSVGGEVRGRLWIVPPRFGAWLGLGVDWVHDPIVVGLRNMSEFRSIWPVAAWQPRAAVGLEVLLP